MSNPSSSAVVSPTLENLIDLFNERKITAEELAERATPLLLEVRQNAIIYFMLKLAAEYPDRYHSNSAHHALLWRDAEAAYDATAAAELAANPALRAVVEEAVRRVEAKLSPLPDQSIGI